MWIDEEEGYTPLQVTSNTHDICESKTFCVTWGAIRTTQA